MRRDRFAVVAVLPPGKRTGSYCCPYWWHDPLPETRTLSTHRTARAARRALPTTPAFVGRIGGRK